MLHSKRIKALLSKLRKLELDGLLASDSANIFYLTGLENIEGYFLASSSGLILFTDFRYYLSCTQRCKDLGITLAIYTTNIFSFITAKITSLHIQRIGFESRKLTFAEHKEFTTHFLTSGVDFLPADRALAQLRAIKDKPELDLIRQATTITDNAFAYAKDIIYPGLTEKYIAIEIERFLKLKTSSLEVAFQPIVAIGPSSAQPHYQPQEKKFRSRSFALIDCGSKYNGYCSDLTRVMFLSKMPSYLKKIIDIIKKARDLSFRKIRPGVVISEIDKAARSYIESKGYGKYFGHSLGHGIGIEVHESPFINSKNTEALEENMVFTVEPGIYLPGKGGIRIESIAIVKSGKPEIVDSYES